MCGIAGFWRRGTSGDDSVGLLQRMGDALAHRGPDDRGVFYDRAIGVGLSFRRLSILDLSTEGHQPMVSPSGRYTIVFNGEIYNHAEIRAALGSRPWRGHSDTEVMLAAMEQWGLAAAVSRFAGMFAFGVWDAVDRRLHLVRDRVGIKPLYYGEVGGEFVFASELKAIRTLPGFRGAIDRDTVAAYMRYGYVPAPRSIYEGLWQLPAGHVLTLTSPGAQPLLSRFWSAEEVARSGVDARIGTNALDAERLDQLHGLLRDAVKLHMAADVPLGAFLSGGVDSSLVVALMQSQSARPVKTFTIGFPQEAYNEAPEAGRIARHLGTDHTELIVTPREALDVIPLLPAMYDEPFADSSQIATHLVSRLARRDVTVTLSGDGGDELFGGYDRYASIESLWGAVRRIPRPLARATAALVRATPGSWLDATVARRVQRLAGHLQAQDPAEICVRAVSLWTDPASLVPGSHEPPAATPLLDACRTLPTPAEMAMLIDLVQYLPSDILVKLDRASMAVGLEARVPLLDHRVVEFAWQLPGRFKRRKGETKWALRQVLHRYVPPALVTRRKRGFAVPMDVWLRGPLREWAEDLLSVDALRRHGYFDAGAIRRKWSEHASGAHDWEYLLWPALMFQAWHAAQREGLG